MILILEVAGTVGVEQPTELGGYVLSQNYPNPFTGSSVVSFELPSSSDVRLEVFDVMGRLVATLAQGSLPAGVHEASFESDNLPNGMYLVRLQTPAGVLTRSATIIN